MCSALLIAKTTIKNYFTCLKFDFSIMQESTKTLVFVGGAALMVVAAAFSHFASQPRAASDFAKVGEPFFEKFDSSSQAKSLEVIAVDPETVERNRFKVAKVDGLWRIPSHENYPAEASARLATTASSVIGIERESLAGRGKKDFKRLGVVDPLSDEIDDPEEVGQRITLKDENDETLADYIIGKEVEDVSLAEVDRPFAGGQNQQTYFYVRHAEENQTYIVPLKLDLSTKFSDWIDPDLLRFDTANLNQVTIRNYLLKEEVGGNPLMPQRALVKQAGDVLALSKSDSNAWELAGVEPNTETFDAGSVTEIIDVLEELRIEDVRQKLTFQGQQLLTPDLKLNSDPELMKSQDQFRQAISQLVSELEDKGFNLAGTQQQLQLVSNHGEIEFGTNEGMRYTLYIGAPFEEGAAEIKVAGAVDSADDKATDDSESKEENESPDASDNETGDAEAGSENEPEPEDGNEDEEEVKSRYMLVRVAFDQSLLANQPEQPTKPEAPKKPEGYTPPPAPEDDPAAGATEDGGEEKEEEKGSESDASDEKSEGESEKTDKDKETADDASEDSKEPPARSPLFEAYDVAVEQHEQAMVDYELAETRYKDDQERFEERVKTAKKLEAELNERFSEWYYVISGENLKALQVSRSDLVSKKEVPPAPKGQAPAALPDRPDISFDGGPDEGVEAASDSPGVADTPDSSDASAMQSDSPATDADATKPATEGAVSGDVPNADIPQPGTEVPAAEPVAKPPTTPPVTETVPAADPVPQVPVAEPVPE